MDAIKWFDVANSFSIGDWRDLEMYHFICLRSKWYLMISLSCKYILYFTIWVIIMSFWSTGETWSVNQLAGKNWSSTMHATWWWLVRRQTTSSCLLAAATSFLTSVSCNLYALLNGLPAVFSPILIPFFFRTLIWGVLLDQENGVMGQCLESNSWKSQIEKDQI